MAAQKGALNREAWLTEVARLAEREFRGFKLAKYRVSCSWPIREATPGARGVRLGECHSQRNSKGGLFELFISPLLHDSMAVAGTVCHELAHVVAGVEAQHGSKFVTVCKHVGLTKGKPTQAMPGEQLTRVIQDWVASLGPYPHSGMQLSKTEKLKKRTSTPLHCKCGCKVSMSLKWLNDVGPPKCACGSIFTLPTGDDGGEDE